MTKRRALFSNHVRFLLSFFLGLALVGSMVVFKEQVGSTSSEPPQADQQAQALIDKGQQQLIQGHASSAVETWKQAEQLFRQIRDAEGVTGSLVNQSVALQALGEYPRACTSLVQALALESSVCPDPFQAEESPAKVKTALAQALSNQPIPPVQALALRNLGDVHRQLGHLETSETVLRQGVEVAQRSPESDVSGLFLSLANTERAFYSRSRSLYQRQSLETDQDKVALQAALQYARQALKLSQTATEKQTSPSMTLAAQLNQLSLLLDLEEWARSEAPFGVAALEFFQKETQPRIIPLAQQLISADISQLPALEAINTRTNLANSLLKIEQSSELAPLLERAGQNPGQLALENARTAMQAAEQVGNLRLQSAAAGLMGQLHRQQSQPQLASREFTAAMQAAQAGEAWDLAYQWQKELGDIYEQQGNLNQATASYGAAVNSLEQVRGTLLASDPEFQFSFREKVEPVYQRYMRSLLAASNPNLKAVLQINEQLQQAELENYLKCEKLDLISPNQIEEKSHQTFLHVLNLGDRFEEIVLTPDGKFHRHTPDTAILTDNANRFLTYLTDKSLAFTPETAYLPYAQALYDQLIAPIKPFIPTSGTLVFSLDSTLQSIPMDMLYDGKAYLFEQYSTALMLGSRIRPPQAIPPKNLKILLAGVSEASPSFKSAQVPDNLQPLPVVQNEIDKIIEVASSNKQLLNETFTHQRFQELVHTFPIVHVATHGQFSSNPDRTNILAWDQPINVSEFSTLLSREQGDQVSLELLTLSACETARGDKRSALGLAGVAVRAGARSTLASLWLVDEESTAELMNEFYKNLQAGVPKAEAKRQAQLTLRQNPQTANPYLWGPFVLVGSWL